MYQSSYAEVLEDSASEARQAERDALDLAINLLRMAQDSPPQSSQERDALTFVTQLWALFIKSLASPENDLPKPLRASLMSIGLGVMSEARRIENGESRDIEGLIGICSIIRDGLH